MAHTISLEQAYEIDRQWSNGDGSGLRLVDHRIAGNRKVTLLTVPGDDTAPTYQRVANSFEWVSGPQIRMTRRQYAAIYEAAGVEYAPLPI